MTTSPTAETDGDRTDVVLAGFARALHAAGLPVTTSSSAAFLVAAAHVGAADPAGVYWAGRATLCSEPDHLRLYDRVFEAWFGGKVPRVGRANPYQQPREQARAPLQDVAAGGTSRQEDPDEVAARTSGAEVLRHRDIADLTAADRAELARLFDGLRVRLPRRPATRRRPARRGEVDSRATVREQLRRGGELGPLRFRRKGTRPRRVTLLLDVSGSMTPYADALLRLGHLLVRAGQADGGRVEVFSVGTRLTRLTPALARSRDPETALRLAGEAVPDWAGGTRLGEVLRAFTDRWGAKGLARGAVLVICSDGWERGDATLLGEQVQRLGRLTHRTLWLNPHRGKAGYQPVQSGIAAAAPHLDALLAGHSLATFEDLLEVVADA